MSAPFSPLHQEKKLHFEIQLSHCRPHYLTGWQPPRSCTACTVQSKLLSPSPIAHTSGHPAPHFCVEEKQGRAQREWVFLSNWCVSSQQPPREASVSGGVGPAVCWRRCVRDGVITHCLSPPENTWRRAVSASLWGRGRRGSDSSAEGGWRWNATYF